jgi:hypothetical protein
VGLRLWVVVVAAACAGCAQADGRERLSDADAAKLPKDGQLWGLCPEVPGRFGDRASYEARHRTRALIREVRRRPEALVTLTYEDAHDGEPFEETTSVRELAEVHLENPGIAGAPCEHRLMAELEAAVEGRRPPHVDDDVQALVAALRLQKAGTVYHSPDGCTVQGVFVNREVGRAESDPVRGHVLVASPQRRVAVLVHKPDRRCQDAIARDLARFERSLHGR